MSDEIKVADELAEDVEQVTEVVKQEIKVEEVESITPEPEVAEKPAVDISTFLSKLTEQNSLIVKSAATTLARLEAIEKSLQPETPEGEVEHIPTPQEIALREELKELRNVGSQQQATIQKNAQDVIIRKHAGKSGFGFIDPQDAVDLIDRSELKDGTQGELDDSIKAAVAKLAKRSKHLIQKIEVKPEKTKQVDNGKIQQAKDRFNKLVDSTINRAVTT